MSKTKKILITIGLSLLIGLCVYVLIKDLMFLILLMPVKEQQLILDLHSSIVTYLNRIYRMLAMGSVIKIYSINLLLAILRLFFDFLILAIFIFCIIKVFVGRKLEYSQKYAYEEYKKQREIRDQRKKELKKKRLEEKLKNIK